MSELITVTARTDATLQQSCFTNPDAVTPWNFDNEDWTCPAATIETDDPDPNAPRDMEQAGWPAVADESQP